MFRKFVLTSLVGGMRLLSAHLAREIVVKVALPHAIVEKRGASSRSRLCLVNGYHRLGW